MRKIDDFLTKAGTLAQFLCLLLWFETARSVFLWLLLS